MAKINNKGNNKDENVLKSLRVGAELNFGDASIKLVQEPEKKPKTKIEGGFFLMLNFGLDDILDADLEKREYDCLICLIRNADREGKIHMSLSEIAERLDCHINTVRLSIKSLINKGLVSAIRMQKGKSSIYSIAATVGGNSRANVIQFNRQQALAKTPSLEQEFRAILENLPQHDAKIILEKIMAEQFRAKHENK